MKKMYKKPVTEKLPLETEIHCDDLVVASGGKSTDGKWGNAPRHGI